MVNKRHILFIVENNAAPGDVRVWSEALAAKEIYSDVSIISPISKRYNRKYEKINGIEIYRHSMPIEAQGKLGFVFEYFNALLKETYLSFKIFLKKPFSIIHSANPPDHVFVIALLFKLFGVKYIFDHHDISPENYIAKFGRKDIFYRFLLLMERFTFKVADIVISTNESYKKIAINRGKKKCKEVFVVRNGPDLSRVIFKKPNKKFVEGFNYLVVYVGVIGNQEGIDNLLRSIKHIVYNIGRKDIKFTIVGQGTNWQAMVDLSKKLDLSKYVHFTGYVSYEEFYKILATADVCVNPEFRNSFTDKSTMIKIMDYMTFGKPIIQFETTEGRITAGGSAIYINDNNEKSFADAIIELLNNESKRNSMGCIGKRRIKNMLNWDKQKDKLFKAYSYLDNC